MRLRVHLRKKLTVMTSSRRKRKILADDFTAYMPPFYFLFMISNGVGTISKAYTQNDYQVVFFMISVFLGFLLLEYCMLKYVSLPRNEKSRQKDCLKFMIWFLYTVISFGFAHQFTAYFSPAGKTALYAVLTMCSAVLFYAYMIHGRCGGRKSNGAAEEEEIGLLGRRDSSLEGKENAVWEKV